MIKEERLKELIEKKANIYHCKSGEVVEFNTNWFDYKITSDVGWVFETKAEAEFYAKYVNIEKTVKMPVPPTWEETKIEDFIKSNKTKPDNYKELFAFYLNNELFNLEIYSDENCNYFITIYDDKNYYKPLFEMPLTKDNYYKALDKMVELWREE